MRIVNADDVAFAINFNIRIGNRDIFSALDALDAAPTIENAIVLPCKVGDTVWYIKGGYYDFPRKEAKPITVTEISQKMVRGKLQTAFIANGTRYAETSIGKVVFFSREEAEKAICSTK